MADNSLIEWTDATWNPVTGCSVISPGCANCYAMTLAGGRLRGHPSRAGLTSESKAGPVWNGTVRLNEGWLREPLRWTKPRRIFVCAHGDLFHEAVPDAWIDQVLAVMAMAPQHTFQVLTKRADRMRRYLTDPETFDRVVDVMFALHADGVPTARETCERHGLPWTQPRSADDWWPLRNVWLGVSAEDQARWTDRVLHLRETPAVVRFVSAEPLIGRIMPDALLPWVDWVIAGGESGHGARPMHPGWVRELRDACTRLEVPFFFKQWGAWAPRDEWNPRRPMRAIRLDGTEVPDDVAPQDVGGWRLELVGKSAAGRELDGRTWDQMPEGDQ